MKKRFKNKLPEEISRWYKENQPTAKVRNVSEQNSGLTFTVRLEEKTHVWTCQCSNEDYHWKITETIYVRPDQTAHKKCYTK